MKLAIFVLVGILVFVGLGEGKTIKVPGDYPTIQQAINAAMYGNTVLVDPGTYNENIDFLGKTITVKSSQGADKTTIDGRQQGSVVQFVSLEGTASLLEGFTIKNGAKDSGGGVYCVLSSPTIDSNITVSYTHLTLPTN